MVVSSQVYIYLLRFIDPSCNPHLSLMSMYRRTLTSLNWRWPYMAQVNSSNPARKFGVSPIFIYFRHWHWYQQTANQHGSACEISQTWVLHSNHSPTYLHHMILPVCPRAYESWSLLRCWKHMLDSKVFFSICAFVEEWEVTPNLLAGLDEFTCAMCGRRPLKYVNVLAIHAHQKM